MLHPEMARILLRQHNSKTDISHVLNRKIENNRYRIKRFLTHLGIGKLKWVTGSLKENLKEAIKQRVDKVLAFDTNTDPRKSNYHVVRTRLRKAHYDKLLNAEPGAD